MVYYYDSINFIFFLDLVATYPNPNPNPNPNRPPAYLRVDRCANANLRVRVTVSSSVDNRWCLCSFVRHHNHVQVVQLDIR